MKNTILVALILMLSVVVAPRVHADEPSPIKILLFRQVALRSPLTELCAEVVNYVNGAVIPVTITVNPNTQYARPYPLVVQGNRGQFCAIVAAESGYALVSLTTPTGTVSSPVLHREE